MPISPAPGVRAQLSDALAGLEAGGEARLNDAALESYGILRELTGEDRIDGVLAHRARARTRARGAARRGSEKLLGAQAGPAARVRVITISYDDGPSAALAALARASGGKAYESDGDELEVVLRKAWNGL